MRQDVSNYLIHFVSDKSFDLAYLRLRKIIKERCLLGNNKFIKGGHTCICFSEAPLNCLPGGLVNPDYYSRYSSFGIMVTKKWLFNLGGRPVIYQSEAEYYLLPDQIQWKHVLYDPLKDPSIDFTWEREWRINCARLDFNPSNARIIVLDNSWADRLKKDHEREEDYNVRAYSMIFDEDDEELAEQLRNKFDWTIMTLN